MAEYGTKWLGIRDCCRRVETFLSEAERNEWEQAPHPHGEEDTDDE